MDVVARPGAMRSGQALDQRLKCRLAREVRRRQGREQFAEAGLRVSLREDLLPGLGVDRVVVAEKIPDEAGKVLYRAHLRLAERDHLAQVGLVGQAAREKIPGNEEVPG